MTAVAAMSPPPSGDAGSGDPGSAGGPGLPSFQMNQPPSGSQAPAPIAPGADPYSHGSAGAGSPGMSVGGGSGGSAGGGGNGVAIPEVTPGALPFQKPPPPVERAPPRPVRFSSNRDWVIFVECRPDVVVLPSTAQRFTLAALSANAGSANPLLTAVQQMIAHRQALIRPGETPYQPQIQFLVHPDALQSYYLAYPALESLKLVMSKEPVEGRSSR
jgi:hypothetical protein